MTCLSETEAAAELSRLSVNWLELEAITLHQPWATLFAIGAKRIETRSWKTKKRGWVLIHSSKGLPGYARDFHDHIAVKAAILTRVPSTPGFAPMLSRTGGAIERAFIEDQCPRGVLLGIVEVLDCVRAEALRPGLTEALFGNYEEGRWGWLTGRRILLQEPIKATGRQSFWRPNVPTLERVRDSFHAQFRAWDPASEKHD